MTAFTTWGISDIAYMRNTGGTIMPRKPVNCFFYWQKSYLYITCNPDNIPSRKTLEYLKGELLEIAELPEDSDMRVKYGDTEKCIFKFDL